MDSEHLLKFIEYFPDYLSALSRTLLPFFGQPLSKQLYMACICFSMLARWQGWEQVTPLKHSGICKRRQTAPNGGSGKK